LRRLFSAKRAEILDDREFSFDSVVLDSLRTLTAWFAALMLLFAAVDPWMIGERETIGRGASDFAGDRFSLTVAEVRLVAVAIAAMLALTRVWLTYRPPSVRWANAIACGVGGLGLARALSYLIASPSIFQVQLLFALIVAAGCVFLSRGWFAAFVSASILVWYATAYAREPAVDWHTTFIVTAIAIGLSSVVLTIRRRSVRALWELRGRDRLESAELSGRVMRGEVLSRISARFAAMSSQGDFEKAATLTLRELGEAIGVDHAFLCRVDDAPLRTSLVHEWAAPNRTPRKAQVQNVPLEIQPWFCRRFLSGEVTEIGNTASLPPEASAEKEILESLGTKAFLAAPLVRERERPWGYMGVAHDSAKDWSPNEVNLVRIVGDILLSALERQRVDRAVRRSEERFRRLFEAELIGMFFADMYGNITEANGAFLEITGYGSNDLPLRCDRLTPPEWRRHDEAAVLRLLKDGVDRPWEKEFFHRQGHRIPILIGGAVMSYDRSECVSFILDLTEQKRAEQKIQQLNAELERTARLGVMGEMAAGLAHEVHQPLAAITNFAAGARQRLARDRLSDEALDEVLSEIGDQSRRAGTVIQNIRDFVRNRHPVRRSVDLNAAAQECLRLLRFEIRQREVEVQTDLAENLPRILTDVTQLSQVLLNLMLNGLQAMEESPPPRLLSVRTAALGSGVSIEIGDTGTGIPADVQPRLFDQFFTTKPDGLGMGLPIARSITESHGGSLEIARTGSDGTTFVLRFPPLSEPFRQEGDRLKAAH
jgi:PAS domain S-box-containing protein